MLKGEADIAEAAEFPFVRVALQKEQARIAEDYLLRHPEAARGIVQRRRNYDDEYMDTIWAQHQFMLTLDLSPVMAMNDEARWLIDNELSVEKTVPDFKGYLYLDGLKAVKREAVNIIR
jgi:hypothetical protein